MRIYKFGNAFLYQKSGIPIGGPVSGNILESVLCVAEHEYDTFRWPRTANILRLKGKRSKWVTPKRYAGDVLAISCWCCPTCIEKLINEIYHGIVSFDKCCDGHTCLDYSNGIEFLELWLFVGWAQTNIFLMQVAQRWMMFSCILPPFSLIRV